MARKPGTRKTESGKPVQAKAAARGRGKRPTGPTAGAETAASRNSSTSSHSRGNNGSPQADTGRRLREAFLAELASIGWRDLSFADIVAASGVPLAEAYQIYQTKMGVLRGVVQATDQAILESLSSDPLDGSPRDRLFDLIMRRLDQHGAHKTAFSSLLRDLRRQPAEALCLTARMERSMALSLDLAAVSSSGLRGVLRTKALGALYLHVFGHWLKDESADSASTMALLDKRLDQAERALGFLKRVRPNRPKSADNAASNASTN